LLTVKLLPPCAASPWRNIIAIITWARLTNILTMEHSPPWEADSHSPSQYTLLFKEAFYNPVHKNLPLDLSWARWIVTYTQFPDLFPSAFPTKMSMHVMHATFAANLILDLNHSNNKCVINCAASHLPFVSYV
jgi:hypothetical protein